VNLSADYIDKKGVTIQVNAKTQILNGRTEITEISITPLEGVVTRRLLTEIPLGDLFDDLLKHTPSKPTTNLPSKHQGRKHTEEGLRLVAQVYAEAYGARKPVQEAVAKACGISRSTAEKRIMKARQAGYIQAGHPRRLKK
jgi:hypothetical protein